MTSGSGTSSDSNRDRSGRIRAGHCRQWIRWTPGGEVFGGDRAWVTRIVCTQPQGHADAHRNRYYDVSWANLSPAAASSLKVGNDG